MADALPLGILDLSRRPGTSAPAALMGTVAVARTADAAGYGRYWIAEHHVPAASHSCPEIMVAVVAGATASLRVGAGGILLPYYAPAKVAEVFLALAALFPGRVELGVGRGPGVIDPALAAALGGDPAAFEDKVGALVAILQGMAVRPPAGPVKVAPHGVVPPPVWLLGAASPASVGLAARHALPYAVAGFLLDDPSAAPPSGWVPPKDAGGVPLPTVLALSVTVGDSAAAAARREDELRAAGHRPTNVVGDPAAVVEAVRARRDAWAAGEVVLTTFATDPGERQEAFGLVADAWRAVPDGTPPVRYDHAPVAS
jgi:alkanesulfonate monooxygenase SsuD/methylene tetrahydromethanopterin reductase-like flavin-dependent oxidoreductase (luciferase family)